MRDSHKLRYCFQLVRFSQTCQTIKRVGLTWHENNRTGATGYVGGEVLHRIVASTTSKHQIACLVRDAEKELVVRKAFPDIRVVRGDLDDTSLIETESRNADIVFRT